MTVEQAVKKFKLEPLNVYTAKAKAKELNVEEVLYMNVQKNKYAYIVKDGARGYVLYQDEKSIYTKMYKGLKMTPLEPQVSGCCIAQSHRTKKQKEKSFPYRIRSESSFLFYIILYICFCRMSSHARHIDHLTRVQPLLYDSGCYL